MEKNEFNLQDSLGYHFNVIFIHIKKSMETKLKLYNLTHLQFSILINLYKNNVTTQKELLKYTYGDETSITRLVDRLESKGYLKRVQSDTDKRKKNLLLTKSGVSLTEEIISCAKEVNNELIKNLDEKESNQLLDLLQKMQITINDK
jgi:DNA-binding MarR family transcriptional regulator